jgi:hypothetical protein
MGRVAEIVATCRIKNDQLQKSPPKVIVISSKLRANLDRFGIINQT